MRSVLITTLVLTLAVAPSQAEDTPVKDALLEAVTQSNFTLASAMLVTYGSDHKPLRAEFVLDTEGQLILRALVGVKKKDEERYFEQWIGPVYDGGWVPERRKLEDEREIAGASRLQELLESTSNPMRQALHAAIRTEEDSDRPADVALSATLASREGKRRVFLRVVADGRVRGLAFDAERSHFAPEAPGAAPHGVSHEVRTLPELTVPRGTWFNTGEEEPTLAAWRGHPILVLVTDPG